MRIHSLALALAGLLSVSAAAQAGRTGASTSEKPIVLKAARMFDGKNFSTPGLVVVTGGKISAVGASATLPANAEVIDLGDATLLPGFIDAHTHLTMEYSKDWNNDLANGLQKSVAELALDATVYARKTLWAGFTTVRDVGPADWTQFQPGAQIDVALRNAIRNGVVPGPRMLVSVMAMGATGGHCDNTGTIHPGIFPEPGPETGMADNPFMMRRAVRLAHKYGANVIKVCASGGVYSPTDDVDTPQLTQEELNAMVDEAHSLRLKTAAHSHGAEAAKRAIRAGIDSIEHGSFLDDEALDMMKAKGTFLVPTLRTTKFTPDEMQKLPPAVQQKAIAAQKSASQMFRKALAKEVKIGFGTDAAVYPHGLNAEEFEMMVKLGMKPIDALKAATSVDAILLGLADQIGMLEAGKVADVVAVPGDPSQDIRQTERVFFVMKEGKVFRNDRGK